MSRKLGTTLEYQTHAVLHLVFEVTCEMPLSMVFSKFFEIFVDFELWEIRMLLDILPLLAKLLAYITEMMLLLIMSIKYILVIEGKLSTEETTRMMCSIVMLESVVVKELLLK